MTRITRKTKKRVLRKVNPMSKNETAPCGLTLEKIIAELSENPRDIPTAPRASGRTPVWFYVSVDKGVLTVSSARSHEPSSQIKGTRKLNSKEFETIRDIYLRRKRSEPVYKEASEATRNSVYWFGILSEFDQ